MFAKMYRPHIIFSFHKISFIRNAFNFSVKSMIKAELPCNVMLICRLKKDLKSDDDDDDDDDEIAI